MDNERGWGFMRLDSPLVQFMEVVADLVILNFWTLLLCLPVVTAGAAFTAEHYLLLKIARGEQCYITSAFFKSFRENFKQATIIWAGMVLLFGAMFVDWRILRMQGDEFPGFVIILLFAAAIVAYLIALYVFPVLSRYRNTVGGTLRTAFSMATFGLLTLRTIAQGILFLLPIPFVLIGGYPVVPIFLAFCFTGPGFFRAKLYSGLFKKYEGDE